MICFRPRHHEHHERCKTLDTSSRLPQKNPYFAAWLASRPALAFFGLVLAAYFPVLRAGFIWDDDDYVTENIHLRSLHGLLRIWTDPAATPQYYPLVHTTFWIEYHLWGLAPAGYHLTNVLLHAINAILLWRVLSLLNVPTAWLAAAVFAVHPVHVESVAWITERKNVLSGAFGLSSLMLALEFVGFGGKATKLAGASGRWVTYGLATLLFVCALLSKTVLCTLPVVIWLLVFYRRGRLTAPEIAAFIPWLVIGAGSGLLTAWLERTHVGAAGAAFALDPFQRLVIAGRSVWFYWLKLLWPHPLVFMYPRWNPSAFTALDLAFPATVLAVLAGLASSQPRLGRGPLVAVLVFLVTIFPALGFISVYPMRYTFVADHYQYLASIGPIVLVVAGGWWLLTARHGNQVVPAGRVAAAALLFALAVLTVRQTRTYHDLESLWTATLARNPTCSAACFHLGKVRMRQDRYADAAGLFAESARLEVDRSEIDITETLWANALVRDGHAAEARRHFEAALEKNPDNIEALNGLANLHARGGEPDRAVPLYRRALDRKPGDAAILMNLGNALAAGGDLDAAVATYGRALILAPESAAVRLNLGAALARQGQFHEALIQIEEALRIDPASTAALALRERVLEDLAAGGR